MLIALNAKNEVVNLLDSRPVKGDYHCPACQGALRLKCGSVKRPHFAHVSLDACDAWAENESAQHLGLKIALYSWFQASGCQVEIEHFLPELQQTPDLLVNGNIAIEVQCSHLSVKRLTERTLAYRQAGIAVIWLMGKDLWLRERMTPLQKQLTYFSQNAGFYFWELDLPRKLVRLKSLLHEDLRGRLHHLTREFPFDTGNLLEILRSPYNCQALSSLPAPSDTGFPQFVARQLCHKNPKWLAVQEQYYLSGRNLLTSDLTELSQLTPLGLSALTDAVKPDFLQLTAPPLQYYQDFQAVKPSDRVYPPAFYKETQKSEKTRIFAEDGCKAVKPPTTSLQKLS